MYLRLSHNSNHISTRNMSRTHLGCNLAAARAAALAIRIYLCTIEQDANPILTCTLTSGLRDYEVSFLRLLEKLTNGCVVEINETGAKHLPWCFSPLRAVAACHCYQNVVCRTLLRADCFFPDLLTTQAQACDTGQE
jgi:hypothetical protein